MKDLIRTIPQVLLIPVFALASWAAASCADELPAFAEGPEPAPVPWLMAVFGHHATPAPACANPKACTAEEQADRDDVSTVRLEAARSITTVAYDMNEPPLFKGPKARARTALRLAIVGAHETGLRPRLVRGDCHPGECDGGKAAGTMQIHPGEFGLRLVGTGIRQCDAPGPDCIKREDLLADQTLTMRVALHILRSLGLSRYTGEGAEEGEVSQTIRDWESGWWAAYPLRASDSDVMDAMAEDALP